MKIGILTFHRAVNYGAVLQAYALRNKLTQMGHEAEVIDYRNEYFDKMYSPLYFKTKGLKDIILGLYFFPIRIEKNKKFESFLEKYLNLSEPVDDKTIASLEEKYDMLICGSDQVWNYRLCDFNKNYFLDFVKDSSKKSSYAASFGVAEIPEEHQAEYTRLLSSFENIAVREHEGVDIVKSLTGREAKITLDPVFLQSSESWSQIAKKPQIDEDYIVVYQLNKTAASEYAAKLSKKTGLKVVVLQAKMRINKDFRGERRLSPEEFLGWIRDAKYVVTDSFHGLSFSIIFNKKFSVHLDTRAQNHNSRAKTLLSVFELEDRVGDIDNIEKIFEEIDYEAVNKKLEEVVCDSVEYLESISTAK